MSEIHNEPTKLGYIRLPEVLKILGISRSTFYAGIKSGKYPNPVKVGKRVSGWRTADVRNLQDFNNTN